MYILVRCAFAQILGHPLNLARTVKNQDIIHLLEQHGAYAEDEQEGQVYKGDHVHSSSYTYLFLYSLY